MSESRLSDCTYNKSLFLQRSTNLCLVSMNGWVSRPKHDYLLPVHLVTSSVVEKIRVSNPETRGGTLSITVLLVPQHRSSRGLLLAIYH